MYGMPERGDAVERFLKRHRDRYSKHLDPNGAVAHDAIDDMLDRYRELADCGYALDQEDRLLSLPEHGGG